MALPILDGNQSATTLSTILSSGQHITAHTVVSLGTQAITDIVNATSAGLTNTQLRASAVTVGGTITVGNSLTISSLPAISGTVTANVGNAGNYDNGGDALRIDITALNGQALDLNGNIPIKMGTVTAPFPISGTVTVGNSVTISSLPSLVAGTAQIGSVTASISNSVTIASLPAISGTVTVGNSLTIQSGNISIEEAFGENSFMPISGTVTVGNTVTIAGTVTANLSISSSAITSGSFTSLTSATLVPANTARKMATVYNLGAGQLFVNAGATATTLGGGFMVALYSGDFYECDYTTTTLSAIFATAGTASWMSH